VPEFLFDEKDSQRQFVRFADELEHRVQGGVGPETIDWIWDEIARLSKFGTTYSEKWRPVHGGRLEERDGDMPRSRYPFVSTAGSHVFHKRDCPPVSRLPWRQVNTHYSARDAAIGRGMSPCTSCNP
jgi:hypothetical protein